jgi:hypothetical protein
VPYLELDALHHGPGWVPRPTFAANVDAQTRALRWVIDGNYSAVRDLLWSRADTIVWLDLPLWIAGTRVVRRSFARWLFRVELWGGCYEPSPLGWGHPEHPVRVVWTKHGEYRRRYAARFADAGWAPHVTRDRLRSVREVARFLEGVGSSPSSS